MLSQPKNYFKLYKLFLASDKSPRSANRGKLTLVNEPYFKFGVAVMENVSAALTQDKLRNDLDVTERAKNAIKKDQELLGVFLECRLNNPHI